MSNSKIFIRSSHLAAIFAIIFHVAGLKLNPGQSDISPQQRDPKSLEGPESRQFGNEKSATKVDPDRSTSTEMTPMIFQILGTGLRYGQPCETYGSMVSRYQFYQSSGVPVGENQIFSAAICRLNYRLQCIPTRGTGLIPGTPGGVTTPPPEKGICRCNPGLGDRAIYLIPKERREDFGEFDPACYIPAGFGLSSTCGHERSLPYGLVNNGTIIRRTTVWNTAMMCVPNAECRGNSKYVGSRCVCVKSAIWNSKEGTCTVAVAQDGHRLNAFPVLIVIFSITIFCNNFCMSFI